jgi:hypothetical protein
MAPTVEGFIKDGVPRGNGAALRQLRAVRELRFIGLDKAVIVNRLRAHMAVEIAIRTFG